MNIVVMGVSGSGKSTIGKCLASHLDVEFIDADEYHSESSKELQRRGIPLTDEIRVPWLVRLGEKISGLHNSGEGFVLACSALKKDYRDLLQKYHDGIIFIYLKGSFSEIEKRIELRKNHFMSVDLLVDQFNVLEEPDSGENAITVHVSDSVEATVGMALQAINNN